MYTALFQNPVCSLKIEGVNFRSFFLKNDKNIIQVSGLLLVVSLFFILLLLLLLLLLL